MRYPKHSGYIGLARQAAKGTAVAASTHFVKWTGGARMTPSQEFTRYNEGGDSEYPGLTLKQLHKADGSFSLFARPNVAALLFGLLLGKQVSTGAAQGTTPGTTTLASQLVAGLKYLNVAAATNFVVGEVLEVGAVGSTELKTIAVVMTAAAAGTTTLNGAHAAGATSLVVASSTGFVTGDYAKVGTGALIEVHKVASAPDATHIAITDGLVNDQSTGAAVLEVTNVLEVSTAAVRTHASAATVIERIAPYTHAFTPCVLASMPWATIERSLGALLVSRFTDVRIQSIEVSGKAGEPIALAVNYLGITEARQVTAQTDTYETAIPFIYWEGVYTVDGVDVSTKITDFTLNIVNVFDEKDQTNEFVRSDIPLVRRDVEAKWGVKFDSIADYAKVYLGAVAGTTPVGTIFPSTGALSIDLTSGTGATATGFKVEVPNIYHTVAASELDAGASDSLACECEGHARKVAGAELVTVTVKNGEVARYTDA